MQGTCWGFLPLSRDAVIVFYSPKWLDFGMLDQAYLVSGGARGVVVIAVGNEHGDTSSNPGQYWLHFT